jgi:hypothetical protein
MEIAMTALTRRTLQSMSDEELEDHMRRNALCAGKYASRLYLRILDEQIEREGGEPSAKPTRRKPTSPR